MDFEYDDSGEWTGRWVTDEDKLLQDILGDDVGIDLQLEGMEILNHSDADNVHTVDDHSFYTFGSALGANESQTEASASPSVEAAAQEGGGTAV